MPSSRHRLKYQNTVAHGGKSCGSCRHEHPGAHHVQDRVHDPAARVLRRSPTRRTARHQRLDHRPLPIGQIRRIRQPSTKDQLHMTRRTEGAPTPFPTRSKAQASIDEPLAAQAAVLVGSMRRAAVAMAMFAYAVSVPGAVSVMPVTVLLA